MARKKRPFSTFSLSFLDVMSCGFGAVALIFLMIKHGVDTKATVDSVDLSAESKLLQEEVREGEEQLVKVRNTLSDVDQQLVEAQGLARRISEQMLAANKKVEELGSEDIEQQIQRVQAELEQARVERDRLTQESLEQGNDVRRFMGEGQRQYLTGLKLGGARILILVDASASMLDYTLVNILRRRNMSLDAQLSAPKWQRTVNTVQWLVSQLPQQSHYQVYTFNTHYVSAITNSEGSWLSIGDRNQLEQAMQNLEKVVPQNGTSLVNVFNSLSDLKQRPDNIYLITDGLPTQGATTPKENTVDGRRRLTLFNEAVETLPRGIPVNIILLPMEGDWQAAAAYWKLAQVTGGAFLSPSEDWP